MRPPSARHSADPRRPRASAGFAALAGVAVAALLAGCAHAAAGPAASGPSASGRGASSAAATARAAATVRAPASPASSVDPASPSLVATLTGTVSRYTAPGGQPDGTVAAQWYGVQSALPVIAQRPGWYQVRLPTRPNGSTAWIRAAGVTISSTPYRIEISLATRHLRLLRAGKVILNVPAGVGSKDDPTPTGQFFVAMFEPAPSAGYGPFVLVTSAHSNAISDWEGSGDAVIGIHGPLGQASQIGPDGAALSHGCIRLQNADLVHLRQVPPGTPITIAK